MKSKPHRKNSRPDWDQVRVNIMRWCLRVKLAQNWNTFSKLLLDTGEKPIVEQSRKDDFWGAKPVDNQTLVGRNVLGRLLMELREEIKNKQKDSLLRVEPVAIKDFLLYGRPIQTIIAKSCTEQIAAPEKPAIENRPVAASMDALQSSLFEPQPVKEVSAPYRTSDQRPTIFRDLKPYPAYKESGLPWLGKVPAHWELRPAFGVFISNKEKNRGLKEKTVLSLSYGRIVIKPTEKLHGLVPESFETYQIVNPGDIILRTTDLQNDHTSLRVGIVRNRGIITSAYLALKVMKDVIPQFGFQFLNVWDTTKAIYGYGSGLRQNLDFSHFKRMPVALPPEDEQVAIVRFLNWANNRLGRAIKAKQKQIALLNEQKQAIIHRAVTRGLDPSVPLKPSGIPWFGDIPKHWEMRKLRQILTRVTERNRPDLPLLSVVREKGVIKRDTENMEENHNYIPADLSNYKVVKTGQFAMNKMKAWQGSYGLSQFDGIVSPAYFVFSLSGVNGDYFHTALRSRAYVPFFTKASDGVRIGQWDLAESRMKEIPFFFPSNGEQIDIVEYVNNATAGITSAISYLKNEIELLHEYRTRLVADVVTGKLDVREVAAKLPEEEIEEVAAPSEDMESADEEIAV